MRWLAVGLQAVYAFPVGILVGGYIGNWMDGRWHGGGYFAIGGILLGLVAGMFNLVKVTQKFMKNDGDPPDAREG